MSQVLCWFIVLRQLSKTYSHGFPQNSRVANEDIDSVHKEKKKELEDISNILMALESLPMIFSPENLLNDKVHCDWHTLRGCSLKKSSYCKEGQKLLFLILLFFLV